MRSPGERKDRGRMIYVDDIFCSGNGNCMCHLRGSNFSTATMFDSNDFGFICHFKGLPSKSLGSRVTKVRRKTYCIVEMKGEKGIKNKRNYK